MSNSLLLFAYSTVAEEYAGEAGKGTSTLDSRDNGTQILSPFRINYAGYLPLQDKLAVYISSDSSEKVWTLNDSFGKTVLSGASSERRVDDHASGDSFFLINFSEFTGLGSGYYLSIDNNKSPRFSISNDPYGDLKYEFFDYFKDHRRSGDVFSRSVQNWTDHSLGFNFIADAGDQGYYTVNAAEAQWSLINLLETHPDINEYYKNSSEDMSTVYDELVYFSDPLDKLFFPGQALAVAKLATNSPEWSPCSGASGEQKDCISRPSTKATYAVARTAAAMARLHQQYGSEQAQVEHYNLAKKALDNAESEPYVCLSWEDFGGEGGYYPNNDTWSLWRYPRAHRDPCASGKHADPKDNTINDDHYAAMVEVFLSAEAFGYRKEADALRKKIEAHPHHQRIDTFFFGAVSTEATLSLLTHKPKTLDLSIAKANVFAYSDAVLEYQKVGYPGLTFDAQSTDWNSDDKDTVDNNFRWGSNRIQLNDARILMAAARISHEQKQYKRAATYTNGVLRVLDQMSGTNAVALAMYTAHHYPFIEHAVTRTHDKLVSDKADGKLILGPNNWTNSNDTYMPPFGSKPGMKMFALTGTGWASREVSIDANASILPVIYFATELAPKMLSDAKKMP